MPIWLHILNIYAGVMVVAAAFVAFFIIGNGHPTDREAARYALLYVFASCLLVFDMAVRAYHSRFGPHPGGRPPSAHRVTRGGIITTPRVERLPVLESLLSFRTGGSFCFVPIWLLGIAISIGTLGYQMGWFGSAASSDTDAVAAVEQLQRNAVSTKA